MQRIIALVAIMACGLSFVAAQSCQTCQAENDVYCVNQNSYQNCMKNAPVGDIVECPADTVCSNSDSVCASVSELNSTVLDVCGGSGGNGAQCEVCSSGAKYACVSSSQYARCSSTGDVLTTSVYSCGADEICIVDALSTYQTVCVPSCASEFLGLDATCSNSDYQPTTTTTVAPTTTPSAEQKQDLCNDGEPSSQPSYFFTRITDDSTCNSYLYCQKSGTTWVALYMTCAPAKPFFDSTTSSCVTTRPTSCSVTTSTTTTTTQSPSDSSTTASSTDSSSTGSSAESSSTTASTTQSSTESSTESSSTTQSSTESSTESSSTTQSSTESSTESSSTTSTTAP
ncbi:A-agglutinin anchorage subunit [Drosophila yakuba]|uniref:A-agglutinin anchorage subunit n=1 Tax=Drosophila yakuba TaxID=7245 RepID=UPI00193085A6|nr:A-agglutinin anchorage subunit [Drosophila yakuba]